MNIKYLIIIITLIFCGSCRESFGDKASSGDLEMEMEIIGRWIFDNSNPPSSDSTILFFDFDNSMSVISFGAIDTFINYKYKIRDSVLTLISLDTYPYRNEYNYKIKLLDNLYLSLSRYNGNHLLYTKTYRKAYAR